MWTWSFYGRGSRRCPQCQTVHPTHVEHPRTNLRTEITRIYEYNNNNVFAYLVDKLKNIETPLKTHILMHPREEECE